MKKNLLLTLALAVVMFILLTVWQITPLEEVRAEENGVTESEDEAAYLIDENFSFLFKGTANNDLYASGWDVRRAGGSISYGYLDWFKITDTSNLLPVSLSRSFMPSTNGKVTLEFRIKLMANMEGTKVQLADGSNESVTISVYGGNLTLDTPSGYQTLQPYALNTEYGVKLIANLDAGTSDVYVNGLLKASGAPFKSNTGGVDNILISTGVASKGDLFLSPIKLYKGYAVNERFISVKPGMLPGDWSYTSSGGEFSVEELRSSIRPDSYSLKADAEEATADMRWTKAVPAQSGDLVLEFKANLPDKQDGFRVELGDGPADSVALVTSGGQIGYVNSSGAVVTLYDYLPNMWYHVKLILNRSQSKGDIYINGKLRAEQVELKVLTSNPDQIGFTIPEGAVAWLDDVLLYDQPAAPSDPVPAPILPDDSDYEIGMQSCSLWREGTHYGWDRINPYPNRVPLLGYYDEGNPEVADWEIKWMAEHGVGFQQYCWFRPTGGEGNPIKDPYLAEGLHDGFFNAKYSDLLDFTIMWENGASFAKDSADFRNNLVPYWIEYYFKDDRYLKIDNKPVISIYSLSGLKRDFGNSLTAVKEELDYLRSAAIQAGFDGAIILSSYKGTYQQEMLDMSAAGFDAIYAYDWGLFGGNPGVAQSKMEQQRDADAIDLVATLSMGKDLLPWGGLKGYFATPEQFKSLALWTKDDFIPSLPTGSLGKRVVMLDNWNEFGEGHFIMPTDLERFGYLDAIRDVFAEEGPHVDASPTAGQKDRLGTLYPPGRTLPNLMAAEPTVGTGFAESWLFDTPGDSEGWTLEKQIDNLIVANGTYSGESVGNDPGLMSPPGLNFLAEDVPYIKLRMSSEVESEGQIFFITSDDGAWSEDKSTRFFVARTNGSFTDYLVPMWNGKKWSGQITQIRIDPITSPGSFSIDEISAVQVSNAENRIYIDQKLKRVKHAPELSGSTVMVPAADVFSLTGTPTEWDPAEQALIAEKDGKVLKLEAGNAAASVGLQTVVLPVAPQLLTDGTLMVPIKFFQDALGYVVNWDGGAKKLSIYTDSVVWNFDSIQGWTADSQISALAASGGKMTGTSTGTEPALLSPSELGIPLEAVKRIRLTAMNGTDGSEAQIFYRKTGESVWNTTQVLERPVVTEDTIYREYVFDPTAVIAWNGVLDQLKVIPANGTGPFSLDSIVLDLKERAAIKGENLIVMPGFEDQTIRNSGYLSTSQITTSEAYSGRQSLKVTAQAPYASIIFPAAIQKGQDYYYSVRAKLGSGTASGTLLRLCLVYKVDGVSKQFYFVTSEPLSTTGWKQVQGVYNIKETGTVTDVNFYVYPDKPAAPGIYYLDDVEVRPISYTPTSQWVYATGVSLNKTTLSLNIGQTDVLSATVQPLTAVQREVLWSSSNPAAATVDANGAVYGVASGTATITARSLDGNYSASSVVTVTSPPVYGSNLVTDPGFEDSVTHYSGYAITQQLTQAESHSGTQSLLVTKNNVYGSIHFPTATPIPNGQTFYYSAWAKLAPGSTAGSVLRICLNYKVDGVNKQIAILNSPALSENKWKQVSGTYTIQETGVLTDTFMFVYTDFPAGTGSYYLDDVEIRTVTTGP
ncbi:stalk domain-containing protein [Cohnella silvisoli]|uniref:Stalk domain-containing protein n=1 Tax=Cohnella silvisoli TaxID=2873699 RepID=A0ABV1L0X0_9BACL|nr:stalk domain-containing protein [Cohnella silvisoli]MCD9024926.1 Ig-like domain-containing protein [Cohnella silvisoli]